VDKKVDKKWIKNDLKNSYLINLYMSLKNFKCEKCNKCYSSYKSLWNHNKKYHKNEDSNKVIGEVGGSRGEVGGSRGEVGGSRGEVIDEVGRKIIIEVEKNKKIIKCEFCNKIFSSKYTKYEHKKKACKIIKSNNNNEIIEMKNEINELKQFIIQNCKIHPKTLQKINKELVNNNIINNNTINNNIINNNTINNNIINNNTIINKTFVNFNNSINYNILLPEEIINILNKACKSLEESIKTIHFNDKLTINFKLNKLEKNL
jgi:ribosomal protein S18